MKFKRMLAALVALFAVNQAVAETAAGNRERVNDGVVSILGGSIGGTYSKIVWDMSTLFDDSYEFRVLPVLGKGSIKGIEDLLYLKGIDAALVQSDVMDFMIKHDVYPRLKDLVRYITVLYNEEVHIVARNDINTIADLEGKKVNFGPETSGTFMTASIVFDELGINVDVASESYQTGLELTKSGEIDAFVRVAGAPVKLLETIGWEDQLHILEIPPVEGAYFTAKLSSQQYPGLIPQGNAVNTVAVASVLAAYNWPVDSPRRARVQKLTEELLARIEEFKQPPFHEKWKQVIVDKELPGWVRWSN